MAVDPIIKQKAEDIRHKIYGKEVRESLASGIEAMSEDVVNNTERQDTVESQFQSVLDETTGKDVISAPEIILARNGEADLKARLDKEHQEVNAQLAQARLNQKRDNNVMIGHRGCSGFAPENSKKAFELAYYQGMAGIETDLTNTTDGVIFCYHDETLDTKTDGTGNPRELTWDYVSTVKLTKAAGYDAYPNTKIATLDDYLSVAKKYNLIIFPELALSSEDLIHEVLDKIYLYGLQSQCLILVNKWNYQIVKSYAPNLIRCLIPSWGASNTEDIDFCVDNGIEICGAAFSGGLNYVPQSFIDYANEKGIYLYGYIINATKDLSRIKDLGIKFIGTDFFGGDK